VLEAMEEGRDHRAVAERHFPGGSFGNGAAMRVAPVGLLFHDDPGRLADQARLSALPTHTHPLGIEGSQLLARAVAYCVSAGRFDPGDYFRALAGACSSAAFRDKLARAEEARSPEHLAALGNGIQALESVPTALAAFALAPGSYIDAVGGVILLGGDTDTLAAMTGALSGAYLGLEEVPRRLVELLEDTPKGRRYLGGLAEGLCARYGERQTAREGTRP
jgi:poly(ADP-ribose) glycohydrolase ARH3